MQKSFKIKNKNILPLQWIGCHEVTGEGALGVHPVGLNTVMLNLFQHLTSMKLLLLAGQILNQVQDDTVIGGVPC